MSGRRSLCGAFIFCGCPMIEQQLVKLPQSRHGKGRSTVHRTLGDSWGLPNLGLYVKTQENYNCRPAWRLWQRTPTFLCEKRALINCQTLGLNVPKVLSFRTDTDIAELVVEEISDALPLQTFWLNASANRFNKVMEEVGHMVGRLHHAGWTHGALLPGHVLIQPNAQDKVSLIDFEKARRPVSKRKFDSDLGRFWRHSMYINARSVRCFCLAYDAEFPEKQVSSFKLAVDTRSRKIYKEKYISTTNELNLPHPN